MKPFKIKLAETFECKYCIGVYPNTKRHNKYVDVFVRCGEKVDELTKR